MSTLTIELPEDLSVALQRSPRELAQDVRLAAAIDWYRRGLISQGRAAEIAGIARADFTSTGSWALAEPAILDASPLILLARAGFLDLLRVLNRPLVVPRPVAEEILQKGPDGRNRFEGEERRACGGCAPRPAAVDRSGDAPFGSDADGGSAACRRMTEHAGSVFGPFGLTEEGFFRRRLLGGSIQAPRRTFEDRGKEES